MGRLVHDASGDGPEPGGLLASLNSGVVERDQGHPRAGKDHLRTQRDARVRDRVDGATEDAIESLGGSTAATNTEAITGGTQDGAARDGDGMGWADPETETQSRRQIVDRRVRMHGVDRVYVLCVDSNAQCRIEAATGLPYPVVIQAIRSGHVTMLRHWVHQTLLDPADQTLDQVGAIIDDIGGLEVFAAGMRGATKRPKTRRRRG